MDPPVEADGQLTQKIHTTALGYFIAKTSIQKHCLAYYTTGERVSTPPSGLNVNTNTVALLDQAQFTAAFSEYIEEIARRLSTQGDALDPHDAANVVATSRGVSFHSDSTAGSHTIHTYPSPGNVRVLNDAEFLTFKEVGYILYGNPRDVNATALGKVQGNIAPYLTILGKTQGDYDTAADAVREADRTRRAGEANYKKTWATEYAPMTGHLQLVDGQPNPETRVGVPGLLTTSATASRLRRRRRRLGLRSRARSERGRASGPP